MTDSFIIDDECSTARRQKAEHRDEQGLLNYKPIQPKLDPIVEKDNVEEVESDDIYVDRTFGDDNKAYDAYNLYVLTKGFRIRKNRISKFRMDQKAIRRLFL